MNAQSRGRRGAWGRTFAGGVGIAIIALLATAIVRTTREGFPEGPLPVAAIEIAATSAANPPMAAERLGPSPPADVPQDSPPTAGAVLREQVIGTWTRQRHGTRTITLQPDGTATADVALDSLAAWVYGSTLHLQLAWELDGDVMSQTVTGGTPEDAVRRLVRDWGDHRTYRVVEVTQDRLVMAEVDDDSDRQVWTAVPRESADVETAGALPPAATK